MAAYKRCHQCRRRAMDLPVYCRVGFGPHSFEAVLQVCRDCALTLEALIETAAVRKVTYELVRMPGME
jgi:hypothetical protein